MIPDADDLPDNLLEAALYYAQHGLPVFPCGPDKRPLTTHGFKDATTKATQIKQWWHDQPNALIGMPTGEPTGIDVLDIDDPHRFKAECNLDFSGHTS